MRVRWTVPAADDLESIKNYLQGHYPHFAEPTVRAIYQHIRWLKATPYRGRPGHRSFPLLAIYKFVYTVS
jgi:plasmid stabilization system protein ParE